MKRPLVGAEPPAKRARGAQHWQKGGPIRDLPALLRSIFAANGVAGGAAVTLAEAVLGFLPEAPVVCLGEEAVVVAEDTEYVCPFSGNERGTWYKSTPVAKLPTELVIATRRRIEAVPVARAEGRLRFLLDATLRHPNTFLQRAIPGPFARAAATRHVQAARVPGAVLGSPHDAWLLLCRAEARVHMCAVRPYLNVHTATSWGRYSLSGPRLAFLERRLVACESPTGARYGLVEGLQDQGAEVLLTDARLEKLQQWR